MFRNNNFLKVLPMTVFSTNHDDNNSIDTSLSFHEKEIFETPVFESKNETKLKDNSFSGVEPDIKINYFSLNQGVT